MRIDPAGWPFITGPLAPAAVLAAAGRARERRWARLAVRGPVAGCCGPTTSSPRTSRSTRQLHEPFNKATKQAGASGGKGSMGPAEGQKLLDLIAEIDTIFWETA